MQITTYKGWTTVWHCRDGRKSKRVQEKGKIHKKGKSALIKETKYLRQTSIWSSSCSLQKALHGAAGSVWNIKGQDNAFRKRWIINIRLQTTKESAQNRHTGLSQHLNSQGLSSEQKCNAGENKWIDILKAPVLGKKWRREEKEKEKKRREETRSEAKRSEAEELVIREINCYMGT